MHVGSAAALDHAVLYRALSARDARFDGRFYVGVLSTGIYCRPICPARTPKPEHCTFHASAGAAHAAGFRPCLRCRPEVAPGLAGWRGTAASVSRALALIAEGALDGDGADVEALATRLGVGGRHLRRLFAEHVGASPLAVASARRVLFARQLIAETHMPLAAVAHASGFGSIRRFNAVMGRTFGRPPGTLRRPAAARVPTDREGITLRLPFAPPLDWPALLAFLAIRAIPGVEAVEEGTYRRTVRLDDGSVGTIEVWLPNSSVGHLAARLRLPHVSGLAPAAARLRRLFDLEADPEAIGTELGHDPLLAPLVAAQSGLRVPGAWDPFELTVRAILGQQVSVAGASTLAGRLVARFGEPLPDEAKLPGLACVFPGPEVLAGADLQEIGLPRSRAVAVSALAAAVSADPTLLHPRDDLGAMVQRLTTLPGIGLWTAHYVAMRAMREPDAFPASDLGLLRAAAGPDGVRPSPAGLLARAEAWRPWRAYAAMHLWASGTTARPVAASKAAA